LAVHQVVVAFGHGKRSDKTIYATLGQPETANGHDRGKSSGQAESPASLLAGWSGDTLFRAR
jgi:hypothetical protein